MNTTISTPASVGTDTRPALKFITCGSVDDGKSTLIGRLLVDSKAVLQDHLAGVQRQAGVVDDERGVAPLGEAVGRPQQPVAEPDLLEGPPPVGHHIF